MVPWYLSNVRPESLPCWCLGFILPVLQLSIVTIGGRRSGLLPLTPGIIHPAHPVHPYPNKADEVADTPVADRGGNFGRLARTRIMDDFLRASLRTSVAGIAAEHWIKFFRIYSEPRNDAKIDQWLERRMDSVTRGATNQDARRVLQLFRELGRLLGTD